MYIFSRTKSGGHFFWGPKSGDISSRTFSKGHLCHDSSCPALSGQGRSGQVTLNLQGSKSRFEHTNFSSLSLFIVNEFRASGAS